MTKQEAFEAWRMLQPSHKTERLVAFEAGYAAAIAAVKEGGPKFFYHPVTGQEVGPLYRLPEDEAPMKEAEK